MSLLYSKVVEINIVVVVVVVCLVGVSHPDQNFPNNAVMAFVSIFLYYYTISLFISFNYDLEQKRIKKYFSEILDRNSTNRSCVRALIRS